MQNRITAYVSKSALADFEELEAKANVKGEKFNKELHRAVKFWISNGRKELIADAREQEKFLSNATNEEMSEYGTLILETTNRYLRWLQRR